MPATVSGQARPTYVYSPTDDTWYQIAGSGARGGGENKVFWENDPTVTTAYSITAGKNAFSAGPITINSGITVTIPSGSTWVVT